MSYDPEKHHRRSIRLQGHDYAGGGTYFVTLCAHRDAGNIFAADEVKSMVAREWEAVAAGLVSASNQKEGGHKARQEGGHKARPYVIMPDHFHGLIEMQPGEVSLGDLICAFKSRVVHEYIAKVKEGAWPPFPGKVWHRNYYEVIVRSAEAEKKIAEYIRMNPWKLMQRTAIEGRSFRMIGNPALLSRRKTALLCSRNAPAQVLEAAQQRARNAGPDACLISGFHSPPEKSLLTALLQSEARLICCPAWGIDTLRIPPDWLPALEANRLLILEMRQRDGDLASAEARNRFVLQQADRRWLPHITPGGMLDRLLREQRIDPSAPVRATSMSPPSMSPPSMSRHQETETDHV